MVLEIFIHFWNRLLINKSTVIFPKRKDLILLKSMTPYRISVPEPNRLQVHSGDLRLRSPHFLVIPAMAASSVDLKMLLKMKEEQEITGPTRAEIQAMDLNELGLMKLDQGEKHRNHMFKDIYQDTSYNRWVASHIKDDDPLFRGIHKYKIYLTRRLMAEVQNEIKQEENRVTKGESGKHPSHQTYEAQEGDRESRSLPAGQPGGSGSKEPYGTARGDGRRRSVTLGQTVPVGQSGVIGGGDPRYPRSQPEHECAHEPHGGSTPTDPHCPPPASSTCSEGGAVAGDVPSRSRSGSHCGNILFQVGSESAAKSANTVNLPVCKILLVMWIVELELLIAPRDVHRQKQAWVVNAKAKKSAEVVLRKLQNQERSEFEEALNIEIQPFLSSDAVQICSSHGIPHERMMQMRWIYTWKPVTEATGQEVGRKAKARLIVKGFQDPRLLHLPRESPTLSTLVEIYF